MSTRESGLLAVLSSLNGLLVKFPSWAESLVLLSTVFVSEDINSIGDSLLVMMILDQLSLPQLLEEEMFVAGVDVMSFLVSELRNLTVGGTILMHTDFSHLELSPAWVRTMCKSVSAQYWRCHKALEGWMWRRLCQSICAQSGQRVFCVSLATRGHMIGGINKEKEWCMVWTRPLERDEVTKWPSRRRELGEAKIRMNAES